MLRFLIAFVTCMKNNASLCGLGGQLLAHWSLFWNTFI